MYLKKPPLRFAFWTGLAILSLVMLSCGLASGISTSSPSETLPLAPASATPDNSPSIPDADAGNAGANNAPATLPAVNPTEALPLEGTATPAAQAAGSGAGGAAAGGGAAAAPQPEARDISPQDLLPMIDWRGGGGGGFGSDLCYTGKPAAYINMYPGSSDPVPRESNHIFRGQIALVKGCHYPDNEAVQVVFTLPDGSTQQAETTADAGGDGVWEVKWFSMPEEPLGTYNVAVSSASGTANLQFTVEQPTSPVFVTMCGKDRSLITLTGFQPNERVLLGFYSSRGAEWPGPLKDTEWVTMDGSGSAQADIPPEYISEAFYVAVGTLSPRAVDVLRLGYFASGYDFSC